MSVIQPLGPSTMPECEHGVRADDGRYQGVWNAPFSRCACCGIFFPYIDSGGWTGGAKVRTVTRTWTPKERCGACGGKYQESIL